MKKADFLIIALILLAAGAVALASRPSGRAGMAVVTVDGKEALRIAIDGEIRQYTVEAGGGYNIISAGNGEACVMDADCPDRVCVQRGAISRPNQSAVCLPHKLVLSIEGKGDDVEDIDSVAE